CNVYSFFLNQNILPCPFAVSSKMITGFVGYNVTLPCSYDAKYYRPIYMCWGRSEIPYSGCDNEIIATDGFKVTRRKSHRYQLSGDLNQGDVSLTIISAEMGDSGIYGCRVEIPGLFNDLKNQVNLTIKSKYDRSFFVSEVNITVSVFFLCTCLNVCPVMLTVLLNEKAVLSLQAYRCLIIITVVIMLLLLLVSVMVMAIWSHKRKLVG
uniref:Ig-like domain-containing protein n=1 Tax=Paramormyrops kingsleyae TaxID=1676925 RepID=A0A3B3TGL7_9TELE